MRMKIVTAVALVWMISSWASNAAAAGKPVKFTSGNRQISAFLFEPSGPGPFPGVVEIHGIYGRARWDDETSEKLVKEGYVTLSVDLYGRSARDYDDGLHLRDQVRPHVADDLRAAVAYLRTVQQVSTDRVGALGWCMGGGFVLQLALAEPTLTAGVIYYGPVVVDDAQLKQVHARLIGFFGQEDLSIPVPAVKMMANSFQDMGNPMELHIYPDARHGFAEPETRGAYLPTEAADAWTKTTEFLRASLIGKKN